MEFIKKNINKSFRNGIINNNANIISFGGSGNGGNGGFSGNFLPAINNNDGSYTVDINKVIFKGHVISEQEISAYGAGSGTEGGTSSGGSITIYDGLDSISTDIALSANQGRVLKEMIKTNSNTTTLSALTDVTLSNLSDGQILKYNATSKMWVNGDGTKVTWTNIEGKPSSLTDTNINSWIEAAKDKHTHTNKTVLDGITSTNVTNWNDANAKKHTHTNKSVLDSISQTNINNWNNKLDKAVWDKAFYFDSSNNLRAKVNVIGEKEISAYGEGTSSGGGGSFTIVDALTSTATDAALSANMGRVLKEMIDNKSSVTHWNDLQGKPSWIGSTKPSYTWSEITSKPSWIGSTKPSYTWSEITSKPSWIGSTKPSYSWGEITSKPSSLTDTNINSWIEAAKDKHTHTNKTVLDGITSTNITNWNDANTKKHTHTNKTTLDKITETNITNWNDANTKKHTHSNKTVLDGITSSNITNWNNKLDKAVWDKAFYFDSAGNLKVKLNLIGEKEISAYGAGTSSGGSGGTFTIVDALTSTSKDAALSANMGRVLKELIDTKSTITNWADLEGKPSWIGSTKPSYTWSEITSKPSTFTPSTHNHPISQITGLQAALDGKANINHKQAYTAAECTTYTADDNTLGCTPAAVKKAIGLFDPKPHVHSEIQGRSISDLNNPHWNNLGAV